MHKEEIERLWTKEDVAKYFNKSPRTIERWVTEGDLQCCPNMVKSIQMFNPEYIKSFGKMDFKYEPSPEVMRLKRIYERDMKAKNKEIERLKAMIRESLNINLKHVNEISNMECI